MAELIPSGLDTQLVTMIAVFAGGLLLGVLLAMLVALRKQGHDKARIAALETQVKQEERLEAERDEAIELARERLAATFETLAGKSLQTSTQQFLQLARENLGGFQTRAEASFEAREKAIEDLVRPISEALKKTESQIHEIEKDRREAFGQIQQFLQHMGDTQVQLQTETARLVAALKRPEVRGQWGEISLKRLVELAGMTENCDFYEQEHHTGNEGAIRPDMIVRLPENRELIVDVKTPLDAYVEAVEATDESARRIALKRHARIVKDRIRELAGKEYWSQFRNSPEFVILFVPGDQFLAAALDQDSSLLEEALRQKIILATPTSFVALLKAVAYGWRQLALADNAERIRDLAEELYARVGTFTEHFARVGQQLDGSVEAFNKAVASLERRVLPGARKFVELGVQARKQIADLEPIETGTRPVPAEEE